MKISKLEEIILIPKEIVTLRNEWAKSGTGIDILMGSGRMCMAESKAITKIIRNIENIGRSKLRPIK